MNHDRIADGVQAEPVNYRLLAAQARGLLSGPGNLITRSANLTALLYQELADVNWVGVYLMQDDGLWLGPFQGKPACVHIPLGQGVCGSAAAAQAPMRVADVHAFAGHIVCDSDSRSELVFPFYLGERVAGVLDIDSPLLDRFNAEDESGLLPIAALLNDSPTAGVFAGTPVSQNT